jgi:uncharacterized protein YbbC (DUF1343 family)
MVKSGLDCLQENFPEALVGSKIGVVCHAASITSSFTHCIDVLSHRKECRLEAVFGPQHGIFGQTQDNMIEWEGDTDRSALKVPVHSLYGKVRKPTKEMLAGLGALLFDLQDVGARPYTYLWTLKLCMEACMEQDIPLWVLDRPNPIARIALDGPMLRPDYFSFVGGAEIPLCHRLTIGEIALLLQKDSYPSADVNVVWMEGWWRNSLWNETGLPWVLPSPNMPTPDSAIVYPGMVLLEATNLSEGRGTTRPFELFGAPYFDVKKIGKHLSQYGLRGCLFREHEFIPTFQKWAGKNCCGMQLHVTDPHVFKPVETVLALLLAVQAISPDEFRFRTDPYEYEREKPAIDILSGSDLFRNAVLTGADLADMTEVWIDERKYFTDRFEEIAHYPEELS